MSTWLYAQYAQKPICSRYWHIPDNNRHHLHLRMNQFIKRRFL
jgi:hypothetical protein